MPDRLTPREIECLRLAGQRLRDAEIAHQLGISQRTVANHLQRAYDKLGVRDRLRAADRLSILYPGQSMTMGEPLQNRLDGRAEANGSSGPMVTATPGPGPDLTALRFPPPPRRIWIRLVLVVAFAIAGTVVAIGGAAILNASLQLTQAAAPPGAR